MPIRYVGRSTYERGKPLFEILARLKNFGVGRIVYRNREWTNYKEPSFYIVASVQPDLTKPLDSVDHRFTADRYFRGEYVGQLRMRSCYKPDWRLVPRDKEQALLNYKPDAPRPRNVVPDAMKFPPLLEKMIMEEMQAEGNPVTETPMLPLTIRIGPLNRAIQQSQVNQESNTS